MLRLAEARSTNWVQTVCALFADDCWGIWLNQSVAHVNRAIDDIIHIITTQASPPRVVAGR